MESKNNNVEKAVPADSAVVEKTVTIKLPIERDNDEDVVVWVNNRRFLIKRGVKVEVPESVALILREQERMQLLAYEYERKMTNKA